MYVNAEDATLKIEWMREELMADGQSGTTNNIQHVLNIISLSNKTASQRARAMLQYVYVRLHEQLISLDPF
jgi:hypothetical protein